MNKLTLAALPLLATGLLAQGTPEVEPNETFVTATALGLGAQGDGAIGVPGDFDTYAITLTGNSDLRVWVNPGVGASPLNDSDLTLFDTDGITVLDFNDDVSGATNWLSRIVIGDLPAGTYFVMVRSSQAFSAVDTGTYTLDVVAAAPGTYVGASGTPTAVVEGPEDNDPRNVGGVATPSFQDSTNTGNIATATASALYADPGADYDFFELNVTVAGTLTMETVGGAAAPAMTDTVLFLADAALAQIAVDNDSGVGLLSLLAQPVTPGTYYVVVKGWDTGNYALNVVLTAPVPIGPATVTVQPGGCGPTLGTRTTTAGPTIATEVPVLGSTFYVDGGNMPAFIPLLRVIGLAPRVPFFDLGPLGAPGCFIEVDPIDQSFALADATGTDYWAMSSPVDVAFIGLTIEQQIVSLTVAPPYPNFLAVLVSNRVSSAFGIEN